MSNKTPEMKSCESCPMKTEITSLLYWKNPIRSAGVLASLLAVQFAFLHLSTISIAAYASLLLFAGINLSRLYFRYIAKTECKFITNYLERDLLIPKDRILDISHRLTDKTNEIIDQARGVFLLSNIGASIKFAIGLYIMTWVGARCNLLTLCILATLLLFSGPKFYITYQTQLDELLELAKKKLNQLYDQVKEKMDKIPVIGSRKNKTQ